MLAKFALLHQLLFLHCLRPEAPTSGVRVSFHNATLDFRNNAMVTSSKFNSRHKCNSQSNSLSFRSHEHNFLVNRNVGFVSEKSGDHEFGTVTDGVDGTVLHYNTLVAD